MLPERPKGWVFFVNHERIMSAIDLAQVKVICVQRNETTGGSDVRLSDAPANSYWIAVPNPPDVVAKMVDEARKELTGQPPARPHPDPERRY